MKTIRYNGCDFRVPSVPGMFITLSAHSYEVDTDTRTYWVNGLDDAANKVDNYIRYIMKALSGVNLVLAQVRDDDTNRLVATFESDRKYPWRLSVHDAAGSLVCWKEYKSLLRDIA